MIYRLCQNVNTPGFRFLSRNSDVRTGEDPLREIKTLIREKSNNATKFRTYLTELNSNMTVHDIYKTLKLIPDYKREAFTRIRVMSHNLRIETGRWSRTPTEQRVCQCDGDKVQTEQHVLTVHCQKLVGQDTQCYALMISKFCCTKLYF